MRQLQQAGLSIASILLLAACGVPDQSAAPQRAAGRLSFVASTGYANSDIFAINADGTDRRQLTETPELELFPCWSPDGARLAFSYAEERDQSTGFRMPVLYSMAVDGSDRRRVVRQAPYQMVGGWPSWSPDGRNIAYAAAYDYGIWLTDAAGAAPPHELIRPPTIGELEHPELVNASELLEPAWSPDGRSVAFSGRDGIYLVDVDGSNLRRLTDRQGDTAPAWSPDGKQLAFSRWSFEQPNYGSPRSDIYLMQADGSQQEVLVATPSDDTEPAWSPDGTRIAFVSAGAPQPSPTMPPPPTFAPPSGTPPTPSPNPTATPNITPEPVGSVAGVSSGYPAPDYPAGATPLPELPRPTLDPYPFARRAATPEPYRPNDIFVITLADGSIENITRSPDFESSPAWQP